jgi:invasion protein IalB
MTIHQWVLTLLLMFAALSARAGSIDQDDWSGQCDPGALCFVQMKGDGPRLLAGWHPQEQRIRIGALVPVAVGTGQPVTVWLDDGVSIYLVTGVCTQQFCEAMVRADLAAPTAEAFRNARGGVLAYVDGGRVRITEISLIGFGRAYDALQAR